MSVLGVIDDFFVKILLSSIPTTVCGGAIRDHVIGKPIGDIDMYIDYMDCTKTEQKLSSSNIYFNTKTNPSGGSYSKVNKNINKVISFSYQNYDCDIIFLNTTNPKSIWDTYDNNLCKFAYNPLGSVLISPDAMSDWKNKTISKNPTVTKECWDYSKQKHIPKMLAKYSDYRVIENGNDITSQFGNLPSQQFQSGGIVGQSPIATATQIQAKINEKYQRVKNLYCQCTNPNISKNTAYGSVFLYCKNCCKEKIDAGGPF